MFSEIIYFKKSRAYFTRAIFVTLNFVYMCLVGKLERYDFSVCFYLNISEHNLFKSGWYTISDVCRQRIDTYARNKISPTNLLFAFIKKFS